MYAFDDRLTIDEVLRGLALHTARPSLYIGGGGRPGPDDDEPAAPPPLSDADQGMLAALKAGDERALKRLYYEYYTTLSIAAAQITGSLETAEEVVNDIFGAIWTGRETWEPTYGIRAYLIRAARNRARNIVRAEQSQARVHHEASMLAPGEDRPAMGSPEMGVAELVEARDIEQVVWDVIEQLGETTQLILTLRWKHQMSWGAIAHAVEMKPSAVQMQHNRACQLLQKRLKPLF